MLLAEDPAVLISHTINNFNIAPDKGAVARIGESMSTLRQARDLHIRESENTLKKLSRTLNTLQSQHEELTATYSPATHASEISRLDTQKFRTAKAASDAEMEAERAAQQTADLAARLQELDLQGVDGYGTTSNTEAGHGAKGSTAPASAAAAMDDEVLLRLRVYRSLGIELEREKTDGVGEGEFVRAVIRNDRKGDVHVVNLDKKFSKFFYANYFWQTV